MIYFKACPKCKGDLQRVRDLYGEYVECLQCGFTLELVKEATVPARQQGREAA